MSSTEKINFSKFFPSTQSFVVVTGKAKAPDDFFLQIDIGDGVDKASFHVGDYNSKQSMEMLRTINKAVQESLQFFERAMKMPDVAALDLKDWGNVFKVADTKVAAKKKPAAKKKAAAKK